jgi:membrane-associated protease RseP (regulator of RpoE activity)
MAYLVGVLIIFVGVLLSIGLHELGHLVPAKKFGVRVPQYMVGFGPTLWSFKRGETEYGIKAIPLGGYVRLVGMYAPGDPRRDQRKGRLAEFVQSARDASAEEILPGEEHRAFYNLSTPKKLVVMFGGPFVNLVIAFVLFVAIFTTFGIQQPTSTLGSVSQCVLPATAPADATCADDSAPAPAAAAGLLPGDTITQWDGHEITSWEQLTQLIGQSGDRTVAITFVRGSETLTTQATPIVEKRPIYDDMGMLVTDAAGEMVLADKGFMGMGSLVERRPVPLTDSIEYFGQQLKMTGQIIVRLPQRLADVAQAAFGTAERDPNSVVGLVGIGRFAGELASQDTGSEVAETAASLALLVASLNLALIPLPPLDGGHIASALYEGARRQVARVRGRGNTGPADTARLLPVAYVMFFVLTGMGLLLIYADIVNPIRLFG